MNFVYLTTNLINGKQYIGSHKSINENDDYLGSGILILKAIKKYGVLNFKREILKEFDTIEEAREKEKYFIKKYNTIIPNGYNICPDGGTLYGTHNEITKQKISLNRTGKGIRNTFWKGKKRPDISEKMKGEKNPMYGKKSPLKGKPLSNKTKQKISNSLKGKPSGMKGRTLSNEAKEKIKIARASQIIKRKTCEICGKTIAVNIYSRFHGEKCKYKS